MTKKQCLIEVKEYQKYLHLDLNRRIKDVLKSGEVDIGGEDAGVMLMGDALKTVSLQYFILGNSIRNKQKRRA